MVAPFPIDARLGIDLTQVDTTTPTRTLGELVKLSDRYVALYAGIGTNVTANQACVVNSTGYAAPVNTTLATEASGSAGGMFAIANQTMNTTQFGWFIHEGPNVPIALLSSAAADTQLYTTSTAGSLDDASAGVKIEGVVCNNGTGSAAAGNYACSVFNPWFAMQTALA